MNIIVGERYKHSDGTIVRVSSKEGDIIHTHVEICGADFLLSFLFGRFIEEFIEMNLAQEMHQIAIEYHEVIDEDFLTSVSNSIRSSAEKGLFSLKVDVKSVNSATRNKLVSTLRNNGFKVYLLKAVITISW